MNISAHFGNGGGFDFRKYTPFNKVINVGTIPTPNTWKNALTISGEGILTGVILALLSSSTRGIRITIDGTVVYRAYYSSANGGGLGVVCDGFYGVNNNNFIGMMVSNGSILAMGHINAVKKELPYLNATETTLDAGFIHSTFPIQFKTSLVIDVMSNSNTDAINGIVINGGVK